MARFCIAGCGTELKKDDGSTDYERQFCDEKCRSKDRAQKLRDQRARMKTQKRCSRCTQPILPVKTWEKLRVLAAEAGIDLASGLIDEPTYVAMLQRLTAQYK